MKHDLGYKRNVYNFFRNKRELLSHRYQYILKNVYLSPENDVQNKKKTFLPIFNGNGNNVSALLK